MANFLKIAGYMLMFNGFCITLLGILTEMGVLKAELARWHELDERLSYYFGIHISPEIADVFGLKILAVGVVATVIGFVVARASGKK